MRTILIYLVVALVGTMTVTTNAVNRLVLSGTQIVGPDTSASLNIILQNDQAISGLLLGLQYDPKLRVDSVTATGRANSFTDVGFNKTADSLGILLLFDAQGSTLGLDSSSVVKLWFTMTDTLASPSYAVDFGETQIVNSNLIPVIHSSFGSHITRQFARGDVDDNGRIDISDAVYLVNYIFAGGPSPDPLSDGDVDCNNRIDIVDVVFLINYIFSSGGAPCID